jgi:SpoVK/Ycf46/Vps4 family AAA+-type ATPase
LLILSSLIGFSGADLAALVREAGLSVMIEWRDARESSSDPQSSELCFQSISTRHFERAFTKLRPSVSPEDRMRYDLVHKFIRDDGLGAIEALKAASVVLEDRAAANSRRK